MAEFLTTQGTAYYLENIIMDATKWLVLLSPYLNISDNFLSRLQDADKRKVKITIVYGKSKLNPNEKEKLQKLENLSLLYCANLHAKCFLNDRCMIITSMNMYEFSEKNNREMGILIRKDNDTDQKIYKEAAGEVKSILDSAQREDEKLPKAGYIPNERHNVKSNLPKSIESSSWEKAGYCIRCNVGIPFDPSHPYCPECFSSWRQYGNPDYVEKFCHSCGNKDKSSILYPQCHSCFRESRDN